MKKISFNPIFFVGFIFILLGSLVSIAHRLFNFSLLDGWLAPIILAIGAIILIVGIIKTAQKKSKK